MVYRTDAVDMRYRTVYDKDMEKGTRVYSNGESGTVQGTHTDGSILVQWDGDSYKTYGYTPEDLIALPSPQYRDLL